MDHAKMLFTQFENLGDNCEFGVAQGTAAQAAAALPDRMKLSKFTSNELEKLNRINTMIKIWDDYGNWDQISKENTINGIKKKITGNKIAWIPNFCSSEIKYIFKYAIKENQIKYNVEAAALDFGCGLGRNGPLLGKFFRNVIGYDLPEMISRLVVEYPAFTAQTYRKNYSEVEEMVEKEKFCLLYDSVVLQHIVDKNYLSNLINLICSVDSFRTLVSIYNASIRPVHVTILEEMGWRVWHTEVETLSFEGVPHVVAVFRR